MANWFFIIGSRYDYADCRPEVERQIAQASLGNAVVYMTTGVGDGTRFVNLRCQLHPADEDIFVACGGSSIINEVASGMVGYPVKKMAALSFSHRANFLLNFPGRDFSSLAKLIKGETRQIDILKVNHDYAINAFDIGFDAGTALEASFLAEDGEKNVDRSFMKGFCLAIFHSRYNRMKLTADGKTFRWRWALMCPVFNGKYFGRAFMGAPDASLDDGLADVCFVHTCTLLSFIFLFRHFKDGTFADNWFCRRLCRCVKASQIDIEVPKLTWVSLDGELSVGNQFNIKVLPRAVTLLLPTIE